MMSTSVELVDQGLVPPLHSMVASLLEYLGEEELVNPEEASLNLRQLLLDCHNSTEVYLANLAIFLKTLVLSLRPSGDQGRMAAARSALEQYLQFTSAESLTRLREALNC
jgi:hypothetical protein